MYTVYADDVLVYDQRSPDSRIHLISPVLNMQENTAGTFEFLMLPDSVGYDLFKHITTVVSIRRDNHTIWTGRPITETVDFYNRKKITCEGALAYLNDTIQDPAEYANMNVRSIFQALIAAHNDKVGLNDKRRFLIGSLTIQDFDDSYIFETNYNSTWTTIKTNYIDRLGGHLGIHYVGTGTTPYIDYDLEYNTSLQEINFGENLLDFSKNYDVSDLFTVIFPKGKEISAESTSSDASDDTNVKTISASISANNVTVSYQVITSDTRLTIKITGMTVTSGVSYKGVYTLSVVVADETMVSKEATYTTTLVNGRQVKTYQGARDCVESAIAELNAKISADTAKVTFDRGTKDTSENIVINIFGKSITKKIDIPAKDASSSYITGVEKKEYTTVASVNNGSVYVESPEAVAKYGRIERVIEFNEVDNPKLLLNLAQIYLRSLQFDEMCLEISAIDLHYLDPSIAGFNLLDQVKCISVPHGMDKIFPITQVTIPLDQPDQVVYTMGKKQSSTMTVKSVTNSSNFYGALQSIPSFKNTLDTAKRDMAVLLNRRTNGYVNLVQENDISQALVISDTPDWLNATKLWKWDINGLGYSDSLADDEDPNYDGPSAIADGRWYKMGITMDGTIVADVIKTGILEDGMGYNYWNLATGEFSLQPHSVMIGDNYSIEDLQGDVTTAVSTANDAKTDASNAANVATAARQTATDADGKATVAYTNAVNAVDAANTATTTVGNMKVKFDMVEGKEYGVVNLINGTYAPEVKSESEGGGKWSSSNWKSCSGGNGVRTVLDCNIATLGVNPPNGWLLKCVQIQGSSNGKAADISQEDVPLESGATYVMSCYAMGSGYLHMAAGCELTKDNQKYNCVVGLKTQKLTNVQEWTRFSLVFTTCDESSPDVKKAGIKNDKTIIYFGNSGTSSSEYLIICGMKVEKGNTPTDWFPSIDDINNNAEEYTRAFVEENVPKETEAQIKAYDEGLKGETVLKKLTDGFKNVGIYAKKLAVNDNKMSLLINASYIKSGMLDANIIRTGWIRDEAGKNQWNLETGYFETDQMKARNIIASGSFTTGSSDTYSIQMEQGALHGYRGRNWVGSIDPSASIRNLDNGQMLYGISIRAKGIVDIRSPKMSVRNVNDSGTSETCYTGTLSWNSISRIDSYGNGGVQWTTTTRHMKVVNGLIIYVAV